MFSLWVTNAQSYLPVHAKGVRVIGHSKIFYCAIPYLFVVYAIRVRKKDAERTRKKLVKGGLLDDRWSIVENGDFIIFPVKRKIDGSEEFHLPPREKKISPYQKIKKIIEDEIIPDFWEKIGDIILLPPFPQYKKKGKIVGEAFAKVLKAKTVAVYIGTEGELRKPKVEILYGKDTETVHIENGIRYKLDIARIMFSSGNVDERIRMGRMNVQGEIIVDLFAGIGYFTLPLAKYGKAKKVYACEKNPVAIWYLIENLKLNSIQNVIPVLGDNRKVAPMHIADRVILGYIHTDKFLNLGFNVLKKSGGVIHYHDTFTSEELEWKPEQNLKYYGKKNGFRVEILRKKRIKSYAPHIWHVVVDARAIPKD